MSLSNLNWFGWAWFAATLAIDLTFLTQFAMALRFKDCDVGVWPYAPALMTVILLWLVAP